MGNFSIVRPCDDAHACQASDWADELSKNLVSFGHNLADDVDDRSPADQSSIEAALSGVADVTFYFGHGDESNWLSSGTTTIDRSNIDKAANSVVISVACKTGRSLGPDAIIAGVEAWIGFNIAVGVISPHKGFDPVGEAIVDALSAFGNGKSVQHVRDEIASNLDRVAIDHDTGPYSSHPNAILIYFVALALKDNVVALGTVTGKPL